MMSARRSLLMDIGLTTVAVLALFALFSQRSHRTEDDMNVRIAGTLQQLGNLEITDGLPLPAVKMQVIPALQGGWNVLLETRNYAFPNDPDYYSYPVRGHAILFLNGENVGRIYDRLYNIAHLGIGSHLLVIVLESSEFNVFTHKGLPIAGRAWVTVTQQDLDRQATMMKKK